MDNPSIRIAVLHFSHDTTLDDFIYPGSPARGEALLKFELSYENVDLKRYYPYGNPAFPDQQGLCNGTCDRREIAHKVRPRGANLPMPKARIRRGQSDHDCQTAIAGA